MKTAFGDYRIHPSGDGYDVVAKRGPQSHAPKAPGGDDIAAGDDDPRVGPLKGIPTVVAVPLEPGPFAKAMPAPVLRADIMFIYTREGRVNAIIQQGCTT